MAASHVDALAAAYDAFRRGDVEAALAIADPDIAVSDHDRALDTPKEYSGPQGVLQMAADAAETFEEHRYEPEGFESIGDNQVIATVRRRGRGSASGIEVDELQWHLWEFRGEKAVRLRTFVAEADALAAAQDP